MPWWVGALEILAVPIVIAFINRPMNRRVRRLQDERVEIQILESVARHDANNLRSLRRRVVTNRADIDQILAELALTKLDITQLQDRMDQHIKSCALNTSNDDPQS